MDTTAEQQEEQNAKKARFKDVILEMRVEEPGMGQCR